MTEGLICVLLIFISFTETLAKPSCNIKINGRELNTSKVVVEEKGNAILECGSLRSNGNITEFKWLKNEKIVTKQSVLLIKNASRNNAGEYQCLLSKQNTTTQYCSTIVKINFAPQVIVMCEEEHKTLKIHCLVNAYPVPTIKWYKNGQKLAPKYNFSDTEYFVEEKLVENELDSYISILQKYNPSKENGNYTCSSENKYGQKNSSITRIEKCIRDHACATWQETKTEVTVTSGQNISLLCIIKFTKKPSVLTPWQFKKMNQTSKSSIQFSHILTNDSLVLNYTIIKATSNDSGLYTCVYADRNPQCNKLRKVFEVRMKDVTSTLQKSKKNAKNTYIAVSVCTFMTLSCVVLFVFCLRKKKIIHRHLSESLQQGLEWDVFVSYSSQDSSWVTELCKMLEEPPFNLTVCTHLRDWEFGRAITDNMLRSVYCSYKMLIIMSNSYFNSAYCMQELQMAVHNELCDTEENKIILIKIDDVSLSKLPRVLRQRSYLDYSDNEQRRHFKTKLLRALPRRQDVPNNNYNQTLDDDEEQGDMRMTQVNDN